MHTVTPPTPEVIGAVAAAECCVQYGKNYVFVMLLPTQNHILLQLNSDIIHSIKRGVEFGRMLQLPDSVSFSSEDMADILTADGVVRPFNHMK